MTVSLGRKIRAARLGWFVMPDVAWVRLTDLPANRFQIEIAPIDELPPGRRNKHPYRCLGEGRGGTCVNPEIIALCPPLRSLKRVKQACSFVVDDEGMVVA